MITEEWLNESRATVTTCDQDMSTGFLPFLKRMLGDDVRSTSPNFVSRLSITRNPHSIFVEINNAWKIMTTYDDFTLGEAMRYSAKNNQLNYCRDYLINDDSVLTNDVRIAIGERGIGLTYEHMPMTLDNRGRTLPGRRGMVTSDSSLPYRKEPQCPLFELDSVAYMSFRRNQGFKTWLNAFRKDRCNIVILSDGENAGYAKVTEEEIKPLSDIKGVTSVTVTGSAIGVIHYDQLYPFLYSRKRISGGVLSYLDRYEQVYSILGVGLTSYGCIYLHLKIGTCDTYLICPRSVLSDDNYGVIPRCVTQDTTPAEVIEESNELSIEEEFVSQERISTEVIEEHPQLLEDTYAWNKEQQERLSLWRTAHVEHCVKRGEAQSDSRKTWFTHYMLSLISEGRGPDELDQQILDLV